MNLRPKMAGLAALTAVLMLVGCQASPGDDAPASVPTSSTAEPDTGPSAATPVETAPAPTEAAPEAEAAAPVVPTTCAAFDGFFDESVVTVTEHYDPAQYTPAGTVAFPTTPSCVFDTVKVSGVHTIYVYWEHADFTAVHEALLAGGFTLKTGGPVGTGEFGYTSMLDDPSGMNAWLFSGPGAVEGFALDQVVFMDEN